MAVSGSLQLSLEFGICSDHHLDAISRSSKTRGRFRLLGSDFSPSLYSWSTNLSRRICRRVCTVDSRNRQFKCHCNLNSAPSLGTTCIKNAALTLSRSISHFQGNSVVIKLASSIGIVIFAIWGLGPLVRKTRSILLREIDNNSWKKSRTYHVTTSYVQPLLLWAGVIFTCRALDPIILPSQSSLLVKQRVIHFARSLSTVLAFAHCLSSAVRQSQKFFVEANDQIDNRNMGFQFAGRAAYTGVWIAAVSLFMELIGFSTQKWVTAGGLGTVLLTLAGREILTNFLSSVMIHATRPFVLNEWIQTKIDGYEVSGTVEHVGWWSPTIIRGDDREAVHIPNHKFTVNIVRNLSQKSHWRIKTHLAISHLDVGKVNNIVADMRKVLAKNPQVEQQKLHRRVFLDYINPENQALSIMVSCFVKTSHFQEYLCVKEAVLLDLLRVIAHHRARLATPIRTVQKVYTDADVDSVPFSDTIFTRGATSTSNRPLLLIEPSYKINGEDKSKTQTQTQTQTRSVPPDPKIDNATTNSQQKTSKTCLEENIVLGVALEGSKRTLPIEEEDVTGSVSNSEDTKELVSSGNGTKATKKGKGDAKRTNGSGSSTGDQPDGQD